MHRTNFLASFSRRGAESDRAGWAFLRGVSSLDNIWCSSIGISRASTGRCANSPRPRGPIVGEARQYLRLSDAEEPNLGDDLLRSPSSEYRWEERGGFRNSEGTSRVSTSWATPSPKGARYHSPGQRPGTTVRTDMRALKGRSTFLAAGVDIRVTLGVTALQAL